MTAIANGKTIEDLGTKMRLQAETDLQTIAGPELHIKLSLSPRVILLLASPAAVLLSMLVGWLMLTTLSMPLYVREMTGAAIISVVGGTFAALPLFFMMKRGAIAIAQCGILGIAIRCSAILGGLMMAMAPAWGLAKMPLVYWVLGFYFPLLIAETAMIAWLSQRAKF